MTTDRHLLSVKISVDYPNKPGVLDDFRLQVSPGEVVGLVGESGSGKSTAALAMLRLAHFSGATLRGEILFAGRDLLQLSERELRGMRGRDIALVLQSPLTSLNPALRIRTQLSEAWRAHANGDRRQQTAEILNAMESVSLPAEDSFLARYPRQLSVGQAQRVLIAMAVLHRPRLLIADEPTSALDMITQAEVAELFARLSREREMAMIYISHDLLSVAALCHRVAILQGGRVVEDNLAEAIFHRPEHPYTRQLVDAIPRLRPESALG